MNAKERFYSGLAKETIGKITSNTDNWTSFLRTMSRNYEFTYPEQVMIYAQRPNATFCKPYEDWNAENYRRYDTDWIHQRLLSIRVRNELTAE